MKKLIFSVALFALVMTGQFCGQMGPANIAGTLYASNFTGWTVAQGNNGPFSWSSSSVCTAATSGGVTFQPFHAGTPIAIIDGTSPSLNEIVVPTAVNINGSGCSITVNPVNKHFSFYLTTATAGLQEAINYANGRSFMVYVTPDFTRLGGTTATITGAAGNTQVTILDQRTSVIVPYLWNGTNYVATPFGGGAGNPAPPQFAVQLANLGVNAFTADPNITINATTHTLATPNIAAANPLFGINMPSHLDVASDYTLRVANGNVTNQPFPLGEPWTLTQTVNRRFGPAPTIAPLVVNLKHLSGTDNTNVVEGNYTDLFVESTSLSPQQGGGMIAVQANCYAVGDCVGHTMVVNGRGVSRGEDEGSEDPRNFLANINDVAGGNLVSFATADAQGNNPVTVSQIPSVFSFNFYEKSFILDVTKKFQSPGNIASIGTATDTRFSFFQGDATSNITATFGVSTQTSLTAPIDNFVYTGTCGQQVKTGAQYPISGQSVGANDAFMTDYRGVGTPGENTNYNSTTGALVGFCATVTSTAGLHPGTLIFIADSDYQIEFTRVIALGDSGDPNNPDTTHFTAFMKQPHSTGATVNFGGAVGNCIGADGDLTPIGTNSTANNPQVAIQRLCYPIVQSFAGDRVNVYTNTEGSSVNNLRSLLPSANTPKVPLTITAPVVTGGVLTSFTANITSPTENNYFANSTGAANSGHPLWLPAPVVTVSGCTVAPVIGMRSIAIPAASTATYSPFIVSGGSGCGTVTFNIPAFLPTPFGIYPLAMVYKSEDPNLPAGTQGDGKVVFMPFNTSAWAVGDQIMAPDWWNGMNVGGRDFYTGNYLNALNGRNGHQKIHTFNGVGSGFGAEAWLNQEPTAHYYGSFANNYTKTLLTDNITQPPVWLVAEGQYSQGMFMGSPPLISGLNGGPIIGGDIIHVGCGVGTLLTSTVNPPCLNSVDFQYNLFNSIPESGLIPLNIFVNNTTGTMGIGTLSSAQQLTWKAPVLEAYNPAQVTTDVAKFGNVFSGANAGACARFDLLANTTFAFSSSYGRICGFLDPLGGTVGDLVFQVNNNGGPTSFVTPLTINENHAAFTVPITSSVSTGTAPFSVTSTTVVPNLNVPMVNGVSITGTPSVGMVPTATSPTAATWQTPPTGFTGSCASTTTLTVVNGRITGCS